MLVEQRHESSGIPTMVGIADQCPVYEVGRDIVEVHGVNLFALHVIRNWWSKLKAASGTMLRRECDPVGAKLRPVKRREEVEHEVVAIVAVYHSMETGSAGVAEWQARPDYTKIVAANNVVILTIETFLVIENLSPGKGGRLLVHIAIEHRVCDSSANKSSSE